jgi:hypothetical protein
MQWERERLEIMDLIRSGGYSFDELAIRLSGLQYRHNPVYRQYINLIYGHMPVLNKLADIPFLPIQFFKSHRVKTGHFVPSITFKSSGTTGQIRSRHGVRDPTWYHFIAEVCFRQAFSPYAVSDFNHLAILPNYAENTTSSLINMVDRFIAESSGGYFHQNREAIKSYVEMPGEKKIAIWGVSFALYQWPGTIDCPDGTLVIETGGMKGKSKEITRHELHLDLKHHFLNARIVSEYGMTELLSQAYALRDGIFEPNSTIKVLPRKINDPLSAEQNNQQAVLNIIDLANIDSCAFIATEDLGKVYEDGRFEVLGRLDHSDIRGCNLLLS